MNVVLVGEDAASVQTLRGLLNSGHRLVGVFCDPANSGSSSSLWDVARAQGHEPKPVHLFKDTTLADWFRAESVDVLLNVHSLRLLPEDVLAAPRLGSFNLHPGPLPRYAGLNSVCWAIYNGETVHGVTLHRMVGTVDAGNVVLQTLVSIDPGETGLSLTVKCVRAGVPLIFQLLETLSMNPGALPEQTQDLTQRTFFGASAPHRGWLSWTSAADQVVNFVRAADFSPFPSPWGHPKTALRGRGLAIAKAVGSNMKTDAPPGTVRSGGHGVEVAAADEWVRIELLQVEGRYVPPSTILTAGDVLEGTQEA